MTKNLEKPKFNFSLIPVSLDTDYLGLTWEITKGTIPDKVVPCSDKNPKVRGFCFIQTQQQLHRFKEWLSLSPQHVLEVAVVSQDLHPDVDGEPLFSKQCETILRTSHVGAMLSYATKQFVKSRNGFFKFHVDGRQLGTAHIHPSAWVSPQAFIGDGCSIGENSIIHPQATLLPGCTVGDNCEIFSQVTLYPSVQLGRNVVIHSGAVIGADGFGTTFFNGKHLKIYSYSGVVIGDRVEVGANSCIDAGTFDATTVGTGTKLDNHVQIGHNCKIGEHVLFCGGVSIGGSSTIGNYCVFGGRSGMGDHFELGEQCQVAGGALVNHSWPAGTKLGGHPARPIREWLKTVAYLRKEALK